jgi:DNA helicase-2/ATP-dependent DNA helicase PcrA
MFDLSNLNEEQKKAVAHDEGPLLIIAGAGTGKTAVITHRFVNLINEGKAKPEEILTLTFSDKAAQEMEERIDSLLPSGYFDLWVSTFHSFCRRVLVDYGIHIGLPGDFKLLDSSSSWLLVKQNFDKFNLNYYKPLGNPSKFITPLLNHFKDCKEQGIYPEEYLKYSKGANVDEEEKDRLIEIAEAYSVYQKLLLDNGYLDFGDLINYCLELFDKRKNILDKVRSQFKYILVDEFQDTNWVQYRLIKTLSSPSNNLTVVGDDDQSIYKFRGASYGNIFQFKKDFPESKKIVLINNYRSGQNILDLSHKFIKQNDPNRLESIDSIDKSLISQIKKEGSIECLKFKTFDFETIGVGKKIKELVDNGADFKDIAVLTRTNGSAESFVNAFRRMGIPNQFLSSKGLYNKSIVLNILAYFKLLDDYHEPRAVYRVLHLPFLGIAKSEVSNISNYSSRKTQSIYSTLKEIEKVDVSKETISKIKSLVGLIERHSKEALERNVFEVFVSFLQDSGYLKYLNEEKDLEEIEYVNQFADRIKEFEEENFDPSLKNFLEEIEMEREAGERGSISVNAYEDLNSVKVMTVHSAKGLEFKYVFLVDLVDRRFPSDEKRSPIEIPEDLIKDLIPEGDIHIEEERRLFYVGITRGKEKVFFSWSEDHGGKRKKKPSLFLHELDMFGEEIEVKKGFEKKEEMPKVSEFILPSRFSFSQIQAFKTCPYQYFLAHIERMSKLMKGRPVFSYGKTIHNTLEKFMRLSSDSELSFDDLIKIYEEEWINDWFEDEDQKSKYFKTGKEQLKTFYEDFIKEGKELLSIDGLPALEKEFTLKLGGESFIGKIDRIDLSGEGVEIVDYKTGGAKEKLSKDDKVQLILYQIAAEEVLGLEVNKLTFYFFENGTKLSFLGGEEDKEFLKEEIINIINKIKEGEFKATPGWHCQFCDFRNICEFVKR